MTAHDLGNATWRKSSRSTSQSNCVEVAVASGAVGVRDTKLREGGSLTVAPHAWTSFLTTHRTGS